MEPNISDIQEIKCDDGKKRHLLDSVDKIIRWILNGFSNQESNIKKHKWNIGLEIDLSDCVIYTETETKTFSLLDVIKEAKKTHDFFDCDGEDHISPKRIVKLPFICKNSLFYYGGFNNTIFMERIDFTNTIFLKAAFFGRCNFKQYSSFEDAKFLSWSNFENSLFNYTLFNGAQLSVARINFWGCSFNENVSFENIILNDISSKDRQIVCFKDCRFNSTTTFENINFTEECYFDGSIFDGVCSFKNCSFDYSLFFNDVTINRQLIFYNERELKPANLFFSGTTILGRLEFIKMEMINFEGTHVYILDKGLLRFGQCKIEYINLNFLINQGIVLLQKNDSNIKNINLSSGVNFGIINIESTRIKSKDRCTARILKDSAYKSNNIIDALHYKSEEYKFYRNELTGKYLKVYDDIKELSSVPFVKIFSSLPNVFSKLQLSDRILLWLNTYSNNHGESWCRGVMFTVISSFLFYSLFSLSVGYSKWSLTICNWSIFSSEYWENILRYLWLFDQEGFKELVNEKEATLLSYIFFILGKIFVGYGIYQTISAFRKYRK